MRFFVHIYTRIETMAFGSIDTQRWLCFDLEHKGAALETIPLCPLAVFGLCVTGKVLLTDYQHDVGETSPIHFNTLH